MEARSIRILDESDPEVPHLSFPGARCAAQMHREKSGAGVQQRRPESLGLLTSESRNRRRRNDHRKRGGSAWSFEKQCHFVREVALGKNRRRGGKGHSPGLMTASTNNAIPIPGLLWTRNIRRRAGPLDMRPHGIVARLTG